MRRHLIIAQVVLFILLTTITLTGAQASTWDYSVLGEPFYHAKQMSAGHLSVTSVYNEYIVLRDLQSKPDISLRAIGLTQRDIDTIRATDYADLIRKLASSYTEKQLLSLGYSDEQVHIIVNFTGEESEMVSVASTCWWTRSPLGKYGVDMSSLEMWFYWEWSTPPLVVLPGKHHMIGFTFAGNTGNMHPDLSSWCRVRYVGYNFPETAYRDAELRVDPLNTIGFKFLSLIDEELSGGFGAKWPKGGSGKIRIYSPTTVQSAMVMTKYAASNYSAQNISITAGWPSLTFGPSAQELFYDFFNYSIMHDAYLP